MTHGAATPALIALSAVALAAAPAAAADPPAGPGVDGPEGHRLVNGDAGVQWILKAR